MQYLDAISKMTEWYVCFQGKPFNITLIQVYALTSNAEEAEVEWFCEDLQDLLELTPQKDVLFIMTSLVAQTVKHLLTMQETRVQSLGQEDPMEKEMATHSSTLAWKIPQTEEIGGLQSKGSQRVRHDWVIKHKHRSYFIKKNISVSRN